MMQIARHFDKLLRFLEQLVLRDIGDATTNKMLAIYKSSTPELRLSFAAMLDMRALVTTTYKLEGDRLEILLAFSLLPSLAKLKLHPASFVHSQHPLVSTSPSSKIYFQRRRHPALREGSLHLMERCQVV
jgi:hypothetical protein